jgi:hypothetical protein
VSSQCFVFTLALASGQKGSKPLTFAANMQLSTFAGSDELAFFAWWTCLPGVNVICPAFNCDELELGRLLHGKFAGLRAPLTILRI